MSASSKKIRKLIILGSTGSIGESALRVVESLRDRFRVVGLGAQRRYERLLQQARRTGARYVAVADAEAARHCARQAPRGIKVLQGPQSLVQLAALEQADLVLVALVGMAGLAPTLEALKRGKHVALATKEVLVVAGKKVLETCKKTGASLLPVDSEQSAVFQCLDGRPQGQVKKIILTASGGPFTAKAGVNFDKVTVSETLRHPRWNMGRKVTVDSATMMNKGLELIEAHWLFKMPFEQIEILIHPESIVHSLVEFTDGSMLAQLSQSDMRIAIQYAFTYPDRLKGKLPSLDLAALGALHFARPDEKRFPCLRLARAAGVEGGSMPVVLNAANEIAVEEFLKKNLPFSGIPRLVEKVMEKHMRLADPVLADIIATDHWARREARQLLPTVSRRK